MKERFWSKVDTGSSDECWEWQAHTHEKGYGQFKLDGQMRWAHRVARELCGGPIPDDYYVLHECDNPACVNPNHLYVGDQQDNMDDMVERGRSNEGEEHQNSKLTEDDVKEMLDKADDETNTALADEYGVHRSTVSEIVNGKRWSHLQK